MVIESGAATMTIDSAFVAVAEGLWPSVSRAVKPEVPDAVGVPLIVPLVEPSVSPAGSDPEEIAHVYGSRPPVPARVWLYVCD